MSSRLQRTQANKGTAFDNCGNNKMKSHVFCVARRAGSSAKALNLLSHKLDKGLRKVCKQLFRANSLKTALRVSLTAV